MHRAAMSTWKLPAMPVPKDESVVPTKEIKSIGFRPILSESCPKIGVAIIWQSE